VGWVYSGSGFTGATSVTFGGQPASGFSVTDDGHLVATVPAGAASGPISVANPAGQGSSSGSFSALGSDPAITSFTSTFAFIEPGQSVTLSWSTVNVATVVLQENGEAGTAVATGGSKLVTPAFTTTYLLTASGNGKTVVRQLTVTVRGRMSWKRDLIYLGGRQVGEVDGGGGRSVLTDHLGTPRIRIDPDGTVTEQKFAPFGESLTDPAGFAKGYTNHEQTDASGLIYAQARFYLPMYGRFASPDPARDQNYDMTQSWNIYSYCMNQPTMLTDPTGMWRTGIHNKIIEKAFGGPNGRYNKEQLAIIKEANKAFDFARDGARIATLTLNGGSQDIEQSYRHSMTPQGGDPVQAKSDRDTFVNNVIEQAAQLRFAAGQSTGDQKAALEGQALQLLGVAQHPPVDGVSPTHEGFQQWAGVVDVVTGVKALFHAIPELFISDAKLEKAAQEARAIDDRINNRVEALKREAERK